LLLSKEIIDELTEANIGVSLSLDGPAFVNDIHRLMPDGRSSYAGTERALALLEDHPEIFAGVISVIDPSTDPDDILAYFAGRRIPTLDFLLPDATHNRPPAGRETDSELYVRWLIRAFDAWFDKYSGMPVRTFDSLLAAICGKASPTDAFGLGSVSLLTIETDGTYHDLDVMKITEAGQTALGMNVRDHSIEEACRNSTLMEHARLLTLEGLSEKCRSCPEVKVCGGGAVPHRYGDGGFDHPSVYCDELLGLVRHIRKRLTEKVTEALPAAEIRRSGGDFNLAAFEKAETATTQIATILAAWTEESQTAMARAIETYTEANPTEENAVSLSRLNPRDIAPFSTYPSAVLWTRLVLAESSGAALRSLDGRIVRASNEGTAAFLKLVGRQPEPRPRVHHDDELLRLPFGHPITFMKPDDPVTSDARVVVRDALELIGTYSAALLAELRNVCSDVQLIRDTDADPNKTVSFSDDSVPGALYVAPIAGAREVGVFDLADSLIHEHRHQKLYLLGRIVDLVAADRPYVRSPWREELRPPSGVLHAVFVFVELRDFWKWASNFGPVSIRQHAIQEVETITRRLRDGFEILAGVYLTPAGRSLVRILANRFDLHVIERNAIP
jgi:uncharacterized protein